MKNIFKKLILAFAVIAIFLAPVSGVGEKTVYGQTNIKMEEIFAPMINQQVVSAEAVNSTQIKITFTLVSSGQVGPGTLTEEGEAFRDRYLAEKGVNSVAELSPVLAEEFNREILNNRGYHTTGFYDVLDGDGERSSKGLYIEFYDKDKKEKVKEYSLFLLGSSFRILEDGYTYRDLITTSAFEPNTEYNVRIRLVSDGLFETEAFSAFTSVKTLAETPGEQVVAAGQQAVNDEKKANADLEFGCQLIGGGMNGFTGCIIGLIYYVVWLPSAFIAEFAGKFLDFFVYYATDSASYSNGFVETAWAGVRDIANIFFIIALIYIAIKTILGLNVSNNKKLISMVVIMALFINFSLFATKLVIDASNITAKVFYNNITPVDGSGNPISAEAGGERSISVGLIDKFDMQKLVSQDTYDAVENRTMFLFLIILLIAITLYAAYIFFSIAFLFVARVVALWLSMIFAPIAFASFAFDFKIEGLGHQDWSKRLIESAVMAPIFVFMLYIIVMFAGFMKNITYSNSSDYWMQVMTVTIPFIILMALLREAKRMTEKYAGELGGAVKGILAAGAGLIGGGALMAGGAALKMTAGKYMKGMATGETSAQRFTRGDSKNRVDRFIGSKLAGTKYDTWQQSVGSYINRDEKKAADSRHARHELDEVSGKKYEGKKFANLTSQQRDVVREIIARDFEGEKRYGKKYNQLDSTQKADVNTAIAMPMALRASHADDLIGEAKQKQTLRSMLLQSSRTGSYDPRGLAKVVAREEGNLISKLTMGLTGGIASGLRSGLKSSLNINMGEPQAKFFTNLGKTITAALEPLKKLDINIDVSHIGDEKKEGDHGHGGGHH